MKVSVAAAAAKSLQSCPTLCDPRDGSPPGSPVPGILQARMSPRCKTAQFRVSVIESYSFALAHSQWLILFWGAPKLLQMVIAAVKLKDAYSLEGKL